MLSYEKNIEDLYKEPEFASGGGICRSAWDIDWTDAPFSPRDETVVAPWKLPSLMKTLWEEGTPTDETAVYIHVPFCQLSCTYCAFFKKKSNPKDQHQYASLLCKEIESLAGRPYIEKSHVKAIFFGGGTPGILCAEDMSAIMKRIHDVFPLTEDAEITMESSLSDMTDEKMEAAIAGGVNRFSFGVQSFQTNIRNAIGRPLSREAAMEKLSHFAKKDALMILDLIYGLPGETEETMKQDIRDAKACGVAGLDLYKLQLLSGSPLAKSFERAGKTLEVPVLQSLFRAAEEELQVTGAKNISCTHWKWNPRERSLYNTLVSNGSDILPIGMACGGKLSTIGMMKPMADAMYQGAVRLGKFIPMGAKQQSQYRQIYQALEAAGDVGHIDLVNLEHTLEVPMISLLQPLLDGWSHWGLLTKQDLRYDYTASGRYWYRTMTRRLMHAADYMLFGKPDKKSKAHWGGMMNMK